MNICREFGCEFKMINRYKLWIANLYITKERCKNCGRRKYEKSRISGMSNPWYSIREKKVLYLVKNRHICKLDYMRQYKSKEKLI